VACHRFGFATNRSLRKRVAGIFGLFGAAKAVASHRTPRLRRGRLEHPPAAHRLNDENEIPKDPHDPTHNGKPCLKIAIDRRASRKTASCCRFAHGCHGQLAARAVYVKRPERDGPHHASETVRRYERAGPLPPTDLLAAIVACRFSPRRFA
jgi:hypothetical protein